MPGTNRGWNILSNAYNENKRLLGYFTNIALNDYINFNHSIRPLVDNLESLNLKNKSTLLSMLRAYKGDVNIVILLYYFFKVLKNDSYIYYTIP